PAEQRAEQRRLAGAVRADHHEELPRLHGEAHVAQQRAPSPRDAESLHPQRRSAHSPSEPARVSRPVAGTPSRAGYRAAMPYTDAIALSGPPDHAAGSVPETWVQGRSACGGVGAGLALSAIEALVPVDRRVRSVLVQFTAPLPAGAVQVRAEALRSGRAVT